MVKESEQLERKVERLEKLLEQFGIRAPVDETAPQERPDYVAHGSPQHAALLGLVEVGKDDDTVTLVTYTSPRTKRVFRLEDEMGAVRHYPGIDPEKAALLVLQQKVNELEVKPGVPDDAPAPFRPAAIYPS
jgi:hypothetical protein